MLAHRHAPLMNQTSALALPKSWEGHLQTLHRQLCESADDQCLLWVDPAQGDPFAGNPLVEERCVRVPIAHPHFDVQFAPYLVPLNLSKSPDAELFKTSVHMAWEAWTMASLRACNGQAIAGWAVSKDTPKALAQHWADYCHIHKFNGLNKLLRFHDPSVREWLWPTLSPLQQRQLLGPAQRLIALSRQQNLMQQNAAGTAKDISADHLAKDESVSQKLTLTAAQWTQVENYATVHAAWLESCGRHPEYRAGLEQKKAWEQGIFAALQQASQYGIHDPQDRQLFAVHALQIGSDFHAHGKLQAVWKRTRAGDFYGGALEEESEHTADQLQTYLQNN